MAIRDRGRNAHEKILDVDASMQGKLTFKDEVNLRINGKFDGTLETKGTLTIGETGDVNAHIVGEDVVIAGKVKGDILAKKRLTIQPSAIVEGKIRTAKLVVVEGAQLECECRMLHDLFNVEELAQYLEVDKNSVMELVSTGKMPGYKEENEWRFERKSIDEWVASGKLH